MTKIISIVDTGYEDNNLSLLKADKYETTAKKSLSLGGLIIQELTFINGIISKLELTNKDLDFSKSNMTVILELKDNKWYPSLIRMPDVSLFTFLSFRSDLQEFLNFLGYEVDDHEFYNHITVDKKVYKLFDIVVTDSQPVFEFSIDKGLYLKMDNLIQERLKDHKEESESEAYEITSKIYQELYGTLEDKEHKFIIEYDEKILGDVCYIIITNEDHEAMTDEIKEQVNKLIKSYQRKSDLLKRISLKIEE